MTLATQSTTRSRARLSSVTSRIPGEEACRIEIVENPIHRHDPDLAAALEEELRRVLREESLGTLNVRFRLCHDDDGAFRFICKVENPPRVDTDLIIPWRWWSPLMSSVQEFGAALEDGLRVRRARLAQS